jgi:hypothetical protein
MKQLNIFLLLVGFISMNAVNSYAQYTPAELTIKINKQSKKIEIIKVADASNVTAAFKLNKAVINIFDRGGDYAGTVELKDWNIPSDEFSSDEIIKISVISLTHTESGKTIELKDIKLQL